MTQLDEDERKVAAQLAERLDHGFSWSLTPQGFNYWQGVWKELMKVANPESSAPQHGAEHD